MWNLAKPGGWNRYEILTHEQGRKVAEIAEEKNISIEEKYKRFDKIHEKIKFRSFGKKSIKKNKEIDHQNETKNAKEILEEQKEKAAKEIEEIKKSQQSKAGKVWELRKKVVGKKNNLEATAIKDPKTNNLVSMLQ